MTVVEIASWPVGENWNEPLKSSLKAVREGDGCSDLFIGAAEEDEHTAHLTVVWDSIEHHQALMKSANYDKIVGGIKATFPSGSEIGPVVMYHVDFGTHARSSSETNIKPALTAKVTEKVVMTVKEGKTKEELSRILNKIRDFVTESSMDTEGISTPVVWGQTIEDSKVFILLIGWDSSKLHFDIVGQKKYESVLESLQATVDLEMVHIVHN